jgi:hypothetical protein
MVIHDFYHHALKYSNSSRTCEYLLIVASPDKPREKGKETLSLHGQVSFFIYEILPRGLGQDSQCETAQLERTNDQL